MTAKKKDATPRLVNNAILVNCAMSACTFRKKDKVVSQRTTAQYGAEKDTATVWKKLFGPKCTELTAVLAAYANLRNIHNAESLPWTEDGWRIVPTANWFNYTTRTRAAAKEFSKAVDVLVKAYSRLVENAPKSLGGLFDAADYPTAEEVRAKYGVWFDYRPIPSGADFRTMELPKEEIEEIGKLVDTDVDAAVQEATKDLWQRVGDAVTHLRARVDDGKRLKDGMVSKLREIADALKRLNVAGDADLEAIRARVEKELGPIEVDNLKDDERAREVVVATADDILAAMKANYTPKPEEEESGVAA